MQSGRKHSAKGNANVPFPAVPKPEHVLQAISSDGVLAGIGIAQTAFSQTRKQLIGSVVAAYAVAHYLRENPQSWAQEVCSLPEWARFKGRAPDPEKPEQALHYIMRLSIGLENRHELKRASEYTLALQSMFAQHVPPADVAEKIRIAGGLKELAKKRAEGRRHPSQARAKNASFSKKGGSDWLLKVMTTVGEFEVIMINAFLNDYDGLTSEQASRLRAGLKSILSDRVARLREGAEPSPLFDDFRNAVDRIDKQRRAVAYGTAHSPTDPKTVN